MPLSRGELKQLIKQCLVEILSEGLGNVQAAAYSPPAPAIRESADRAPIKGKSVVQPRRPSRDPFLDSRPRSLTPVSAAPGVSPLVQEAIRRETGGKDNIMASILADTAANTMPQQLAEDRAMGGSPSAAPGISQVEQFRGAPEDVFGEETASRWASLAFDTPKKSA